MSLPASQLVAVVFQLVEGARVFTALLNDASLDFLVFLMLEWQLSHLAMQGTTHCRGEKYKLCSIHHMSALAVEPRGDPFFRHQTYKERASWEMGRQLQAFPQADALRAPSDSKFPLPK